MDARVGAMAAGQVCLERLHSDHGPAGGRLAEVKCARRGSAAHPDHPFTRVARAVTEAETDAFSGRRSGHVRATPRAAQHCRAAAAQRATARRRRTTDGDQLMPGAPSPPHPDPQQRGLLATPVSSSAPSPRYRQLQPTADGAETKRPQHVPSHASLLPRETHSRTADGAEGENQSVDIKT